MLITQGYLEEFVADVFTIIIYLGMYKAIVFELYIKINKENLSLFLLLSESFLNKYCFQIFLRESIFFKLNSISPYFYILFINFSVFYLK